MNKLQKIFSRRFPYFIAQKFRDVLNRYITLVDLKEIQKKERAWDRLFSEKVYCDFKLMEDTSIRLYKDSNLSRLIFDGFEAIEQSFVKSCLRKGDYFVDIGANIGLFSLITSRIVGDSGKVICFEPTPLTFERLTENLKHNNCLNVDARNVGLSDKSGFLKLNVSENGFDAWNSFTVTDNTMLQAVVEVPISTLDYELKNVDLSKIRLVKIDVEGWEKFVINGGRFFFSKYSPIVMVEFTEANTFAAGYYVQEIYDMMTDMGFQWYRFDGNVLRPETKQLHYPYVNLIAIKNSVFKKDVNEVFNYNSKL